MRDEEHKGSDTGSVAVGVRGLRQGWAPDLLSKHIIVQLQLVKPLQFFR